MHFNCLSNDHSHRHKFSFSLHFSLYSLNSVSQNKPTTSTVHCLPFIVFKESNTYWSIVNRESCLCPVLLWLIKLKSIPEQKHKQQQQHLTATIICPSDLLWTCVNTFQIDWWLHVRLTSPLRIITPPARTQHPSSAYSVQYATQSSIHCPPIDDSN